jgi:hypothetical protein
MCTVKNKLDKRNRAKILITRSEDGTLDTQNGNFRQMHYGHFARKPKHLGVVSVQNVTIDLSMQRRGGVSIPTAAIPTVMVLALRNKGTTT